MNKHVLFEIKMLQNSIARVAFKDIKLDNNISPPSLIQIEIILYLLQNENNEIYQKDLENIFKLRRSTISGILHTMEKNSLIKRIDSKKDARVKKIILTKEARLIYNKRIEYFKTLEEKLRRNISEKKFKIFLEVLEQMQKNIEE